MRRDIYARTEAAGTPSLRCPAKQRKKPHLQRKIGKPLVGKLMRSEGQRQKMEQVNFSSQLSPTLAVAENCITWYN